MDFELEKDGTIIRYINKNKPNSAQNIDFDIPVDEELTFEQSISRLKAKLDSVADEELRDFVANYINKSVEMGILNEENFDRISANLNELTEIRLLREADTDLGYGQNFYGYTDTDANKIYINTNDGHGGFDAMRFGEPFRREMYLYHELTHQALRGGLFDIGGSGYARRMIEEYVVQNYAEEVYYSTHNLSRPARENREPIDCHANVVRVDTNLDYYGEFQEPCDWLFGLVYGGGESRNNALRFTRDAFDNDFFTSMALAREDIASFFPDFHEIFLYNYRSFAEGLTREQEIAYQTQLTKTNEKLQAMQADKSQENSAPVMQ